MNSLSETSAQQPSTQTSKLAQNEMSSLRINAYLEAILAQRNEAMTREATLIAAGVVKDATIAQLRENVEMLMRNLESTGMTLRNVQQAVKTYQEEKELASKDLADPIEEIKLRGKEMEKEQAKVSILSKRVEELEEALACTQSSSSSLKKAKTAKAAEPN